MDFGGHKDKLNQRIVLSPEEARALRKAAGLSEELPAESTPAVPLHEEPREERREIPFEQDANPTMQIDAREVRKRLAEEEARLAEEKKAELLKAIGDNLDDLMPDTKK
ncbi:MAG: hypothetical protein RL681_187 [Candidatus Parcubacteria bacterium]|jgi:acetyl-CoA carboxylase carboxyltransferase component